MKANRLAWALSSLLAATIITGCGGDGSTTPANSNSSSGSSVTLHAAPGNSSVQMFGDRADNAEEVVATFPSGTRCEALTGPKAVAVEGISMQFYRLNCSGTTGMVNAKWVDKN